MSADTVLARKWRPKQFSEVVGQEPVVRALMQALSSGRLHHAYLFTGTRGVGKTTLARIFAKALNCRQGPSAEPCQDDIAQAIDEGRFVDLIEIDAASRTKVEDTRELLDNVQYAPSVGRFKIYLIDEVHMLSTHSFNALLKTLEEPPAHVKFLLATTDPHKLPVTILSRCLQFHLRPMTPEILQGHLARVLAAEGIATDAEALALIARMAQGSVRDALSLLDQAIVLGGGQVGEASTRQMLGLASDAQVLDALGALVQQDVDTLLAIFADWIEWGADFDRLQQQVLEKLHRLAMLQVFPALAEPTESSLLALAQQASAEQVQVWLQIALMAQEDMRLAPTAQMGFELMLMRLVAFHPVTVGAPAAGVSTPRAAPAPSRPPAVRAPAPTPIPPERPSVPPIVITPAAAPASESPPSGAVSGAEAALALLGLSKAPAEKKTVESAPPVLTPAPAPAPASVPADVAAQAEPVEVSVAAGSEVGDLSVWSLADWTACMDAWRLSGAARELASKCVRLSSDEEGQLLLACSPAFAGALGLMRGHLEAAIAKAEPELSIRWHDGWQTGWLSPHDWQEQQQRELRAQVQQSMSADPRFQALTQALTLTPNWAQLTPLPDQGEKA